MENLSARLTTRPLADLHRPRPPSFPRPPWVCRVRRRQAESPGRVGQPASPPRNPPSRSTDRDGGLRLEDSADPPYKTLEPPLVPKVSLGMPSGTLRVLRGRRCG